MLVGHLGGTTQVLRGFLAEAAGGPREVGCVCTDLEGGLGGTPGETLHCDLNKGRNVTSLTARGLPTNPAGFPVSAWGESPAHQSVTPGPGPPHPFLSPSLSRSLPTLPPFLSQCFSSRCPGVGRMGKRYDKSKAGREGRSQSNHTGSLSDSIFFVFLATHCADGKAESWKGQPWWGRR